MLLVGLAANTVAMSLLVASNAVRGDAGAFPMLLVATASLGLGFGLTLGSLSTFAGAFQPDRREVALTALNVLLGLGTALSPLLIAFFLDVGEWWYLPLGAAAGLAVVFVIALVQPLVVEQTTTASGPRARVPALFWLFAAALVIYGAAETMFGNWGTTLLADDGVERHIGHVLRWPRSGPPSPSGACSSPSSPTTSTRCASTSCCHGSSRWRC